VNLIEHMDEFNNWARLLYRSLETLPLLHAVQGSCSLAEVVQ